MAQSCVHTLPLHIKVSHLFLGIQLKKKKEMKKSISVRD
jgi:hypothetical protein